MQKTHSVLEYQYLNTADTAQMNNKMDNYCVPFLFLMKMVSGPTSGNQYIGYYFQIRQYFILVQAKENNQFYKTKHITYVQFTMYRNSQDGMYNHKYNS